MTWDERLKAWSEACQRATAGPWGRCQTSEGKCTCGLIWSLAQDGVIATVGVNHEGESDLAGAPQHADADFIALARTALPEAVQRIRELEAALTKAADDMENIVGYVPEYFQDKWDMADDVKAARDALKGKP